MGIEGVKRKRQMINVDNILLGISTRKRRLVKVRINLDSI
jgi:hypothetical protein